MERWSSKQYQDYLSTESKPKVNKYRNKKCIWKGKWKDYTDIKFDSIKEMDRFNELRIMEKAGTIRDLDIQRKFVLKEKDDRAGAISYICDFYYVHHTGKIVVEDVKSDITKKLPTYRMKKKLFLSKYRDINFLEI